jgi:hypothetical protein
MNRKIRYFSIEQCETCQDPEMRCFSANLVSNQYQLCKSAELREMLDDWVCDECGSQFGLQDTRHKIPVPPSNELEKLKHTSKQERNLELVKAKMDLVVICDQCFKKKPGKLYEIFDFN